MHRFLEFPKALDLSGHSERFRKLIHTYIQKLNPHSSGLVARNYTIEFRSRVLVLGRRSSSKRKDHRYYELVEDTIQPDFVFRYFAIKDEDGSVRAVQPFFVIDQDLLLGTNTRLGAVIGFIRRCYGLAS